MVNYFTPSTFLYPTTRVIIDATEINPFSTRTATDDIFVIYTYKALVGISPGGAVTFISELFPGSISDKQLTLHSEWVVRTFGRRRFRNGRSRL